MSSIILKKSSVTGKVPVTGDLAYGELALNYADGKLFYKKSDNTIQELTGGGGATNLDGLTDVVITTPTTDQVLAYNGTNWINTSAPDDMLKELQDTKQKNITYGTAPPTGGVDGDIYLQYT